ncbi:hypothetical protein [Roseovarius pacificus]|uniref:hypothetical protein n=1 Tax=Roseovarius pacificus TaxID=337701 RepID=UPI004039DBCF
MKLFKTLAAGAAMMVAGMSPVVAQTSYEGEQVTLLINYGAGGSTDVEGRLVAKHLSKHIPGNPDIIVQNMPGGGGNIGSNYLGTSAKADGMTVGFFTWNPIDQIIDAPGLMIKYNEFDFVAGISQPTIFYMRKDVEPGVDSPKDLLSTGGFKAGTLSPTIHQTVRTRLALDLLDVPYNLVSGYKGLKAIATAVLQDEVQLSNGSLTSYSSAIIPMLVEPGVATPLFHFDVEKDGEFHPDPLLDQYNTATFLDLYHAKYGDNTMPSGEKWEALRLINNIMEAMYRSVFMPADSPDDAVEIMRAAFRALSEDPDFIAEYAKTIGIEPRMTVGQAGQNIIDELGDLSPAFVESFTAYVNQ